MRNRILIAVLIGVLVIFTLAACTSKKPSGEGKPNGDGQDKKPVLKALIHEADDNAKVFLPLIEGQIKEALKDYTISFDFTPGDTPSYETKIRTLISGGQTPDVFYTHGGANAEPYLKADGVLALDDILEDLGYWDLVIPSVKVPADDGKIYAVMYEPILYEIILYNPKIFEEHNLTPPKTYEEFVKVCQTLKDADIIPLALGGKEGWPVSMFAEGLAYSVDPLITKKVVSGEAKFADEPYKQAATKIKELLDKGFFPDNIAMTGNSEAAQMFYAGKVAMNPNGSWALASANREMEGNVDFMFYPVLDNDASKYGQSNAGGPKKNAGIMVSKKTEFPKEATELAIAIGKYRGKFEYEQNGNPAIAFIPEKNGYKDNDSLPQPTKRLIEAAAKFQNVFGFIQDVLPTAEGFAITSEAGNKFMTGNVSVNDYLKEMDSALED